MVNDNLSEEQHLIKPQVTVQYENTFNERIEKLRKDPLYDIKKTANTATYKTNFDSQKMVVLQIPYDSGWSLTATRVEDNQITSPKVYKSHGGFISYLAEPGEYEYHLSYTTPYLKEGILIMAIGMLCVGCYVIGAYIYDTDKKKYLARTLD